MSPLSIWYLIKYLIPLGCLTDQYQGGNILIVRPPAPGEEIVLSLSPLSHISNLIIDIYYILSVAGTSVFPGYDVLRVNKDKELWELFSEVRALVVVILVATNWLEIRNVISRTSCNNADYSVSFCQ